MTIIMYEGVDAHTGDIYTIKKEASNLTELICTIDALMNRPRPKGYRWRMNVSGEDVVVYVEKSKQD